MKNETARREIESLDYYLQNHTDDYSEESHTAMMMAIKALEQQPRWIPVYEKLPEQEGWYLISLGDKTYGGADVDMYCKGWVKYGTHVLAWLPLPEPYEERKASVLEQIAEKQDSLLATIKAWDDEINKNGYVN